MLRISAMLLTAILIIATAATGAEIHQAIIDGDLVLTKKLIEMDRGLLEQLDDAGFTPLLRAVAAGQLELTQYLIEKGADRTAANARGSDIITQAAYFGHLELTRYLLAEGFEVDRRNQGGFTPFIFACYGGYTDIARLLLDAGADLYARDNALGGSAAHWTANHGSREVMQMIAERGLSLTEPCTRDGRQPILWASNADNIDVLAVLLEAGVDADTPMPDGWTPLLNACRADRLETARMLLEAGANPNLSDTSGTAPIRRAVVSGNLDLLRLLIDHGADVNPVDNDGRSASCNGQVSGSTGQTLLHTAAIKGSTEMTAILLKNEAVVNAIDNDDHTPLYYAARYGHRNVAEQLTEAGGSATDLIENYGFSPLIEKPVLEGQAEIWYLGHCGFAVKTKSHVMIFDYYTDGSNPAELLLANGHINPAELANQEVTVFVTHEHQDHLDSAIFSWAEQLPNITYVAGCRFEDVPMFRDSGYDGPAYEYLEPREQRTVNGIDITTIASNDGGVGFLVKVDGLELYHAGDHSGWNPGELSGFVDEIDYLAERVTSLDLAFVNVTGCHAGDTTALAEATCYTLEKLSPQIWVPTHGLDREEVYQTFADKIVRMGFNTESYCPQHRGDRFGYRKEDI
jgi:hypothetical protein